MPIFLSKQIYLISILNLNGLVSGISICSKMCRKAEKKISKVIDNDALNTLIKLFYEKCPYLKIKVLDIITK